MNKLILAGAAALAVSGCASIIEGGGPQSVTIASTPDKAAVKIVDKHGQKVSEGQTPMTVALKKGDGYFSAQKYIVTVSKEGYADKSIPIDAHVNGWYIGGNLLLGGLIGWLIVDPATGAMWTLAPDTVTAALDGATTTSSADNSMQLKVILAEDLPIALWNEAQPLK